MKTSMLRGILLGLKDPSVLASNDNAQRALPCAAASEARDGEAPESSHDGSLREKRIRAVRLEYVLQATF